jgi:hypothetical protein
MILHEIWPHAEYARSVFVLQDTKLQGTLRPHTYQFIISCIMTIYIQKVSFIQKQPESTFRTSDTRTYRQLSTCHREI